MTRDKKILYIISTSLLVVLLLALFIPFDNSRIVAAVLLVPAAVIVFFAIRKRTIHSINKRQVLLLVSVIAALWVMILYLSGAYFGFYRNGNPNMKPLLSKALPITLSIIAIEIIRSVLRAQKEKTIDVLAYLFCTIAELLLFANISQVQTFNQFMEMIGLVLVPAVMGNLLYHYLSVRYGFLPGTVYRLILALYPYLISYEPNIPDAMMAFGLMILPILVYLFIRTLFERKQVTHRKMKVWEYIGLSASVLVMISIVMIISCQFRFGMLVIATESMTGELNKGDAVVYERYDGEIIEEGQVIIFLQDESRIVHRVVKIETIDGETRYYTKGDANDDWDKGYLTEADLFGTVKFKIAYAGYPTLWMREAFSDRQ